MCVAHLRMEEHQAPPIGPEESSESVYRQVPIHILGEQEQSQPQPPHPQVLYPPFMQEFLRAIREMAEKSNESTLDENYEKIRK